jgi:hypothetical protein
VVKALWGKTGEEPDTLILRIKQELRLATLLHDIGHSLYSRTSELVYEKLCPLVEASEELSSFLGKQKGAGEVLVFCFALTPAVARLLIERQQLIGDRASDDYEAGLSATWPAPRPASKCQIKYHATSSAVFFSAPLAKHAFGRHVHDRHFPVHIGVDPLAARQFVKHALADVEPASPR